jgi:hypothetical protein
VASNDELPRKKPDLSDVNRPDVNRHIDSPTPPPLAVGSRSAWCIWRYDWSLEDAYCPLPCDDLMQWCHFCFGNLCATCGYCTGKCSPEIP